MMKTVKVPSEAVLLDCNCVFIQTLSGMICEACNAIQGDLWNVLMAYLHTEPGG